MFLVHSTVNGSFEPALTATRSLMKLPRTIKPDGVFTAPYIQEGRAFSFGMCGTLNVRKKEYLFPVRLCPSVMRNEFNASQCTDLCCNAVLSKLYLRPPIIKMQRTWWLMLHLQAHNGCCLMASTHSFLLFNLNDWKMTRKWYCNNTIRIAEIWLLLLF